jgi:hypothetical protein
MTFILLKITMQGPYPIFCRGHSGGRLVCEAFIHNNIDMGHVAPDRKDTDFFAIHNPLIREIILNAYQYWHADIQQQQYYQNLMKRCIIEYRNKEIQTNGPFGWKMGISLFTMPMVMDAFPTAKAIHLIRDGRDVMLSRLEARFGDNNLTVPVNKLVVFGDTEVDNFAGHPLTPATVATYRNELEMLHWVTAVSYGLKGRIYGERYLEVKYEDICREPIPIFEQIFDFIEVPFLATTKDWLAQATYTNKIAKWKTLPADKLKKPLEIGEPLL